MWTVLFIRWTNGACVSDFPFLLLPFVEVSPFTPEANSSHNVLELRLSEIFYHSENVHGGEFYQRL